MPTDFYTVKTGINGEVLLCGVKAGSYVVVIPRECDPVGVVVEDSDLDDQEIIQEIILQPRRGS